VLNKLLPIFDYVPGDRSPPPAPKHATATSKPKVPRQSAANRQQAPGRRATKVETVYNRDPRLTMPVVPQHQQSMPDDSTYETQSFRQEQTPSVMMSEDGDLPGSQYSNRKRKRELDQPPQMSYAEQQHLLWTDELLDYFMLQNSSDPLPKPPDPPSIIDLNRPVDDKGHTPMHWAAAMGDLHVVNDLLGRQTRIDCQAHNGETPLMRAVMFTNNWDKQTMDRLISSLHPTVGMSDWFGSSVFHHIAATTCSKSKYQCARYYLDTILSKLSEILAPGDITKLLDIPDHNGDTAVILAARYGARKCVRSLLNFDVNVTTQNQRGETADDLIKDLNARRRDRYRQTGSSSPPPQTNGSPSNIRSSPTVMPATVSPSRQRQRESYYRSEAATMLSTQLPTLITSRTEALAAAFEAELQEREVESQEIDRLIEQRRQEMLTLQQRSLALRHRIASEGDVEDGVQARELDALLRESERLLELEQAAELVIAVQEEESNHSSEATDDVPEERVQLAHALHAQQTQRLQLITDMVQAQSLAGSGSTESRYDMYKRLIGTALGVAASEVEEDLPEILRTLEESTVPGPAGVGVSEEREGRADIMEVDGGVGMGGGGVPSPMLKGGYGFGQIGSGMHMDVGANSRSASGSGSRLNEVVNGHQIIENGGQGLSVGVMG
jgi:transcription factor MBP1